MPRSRTTLPQDPSGKPSPIDVPLGVPLDEAGRYVPRRVLGSGGLGAVLECEDRVLGRAVAIKVLLRHDDPRYADLLAREARLLGGLEHPNIVPVYELSESPPFYVMRVLEPRTLEQIVIDLRRGDPDAHHDFPLGRLLRVFLSVCDAIEFAHDRGIAHCDIKPANVVIGSHGEVVVVDWGLAHHLEQPLVYRGGTLGYAAPEQFDEAFRGAVDRRIDVFALGALLYELLALEPALPDDDATRASLLAGSGYGDVDVSRLSARGPSVAGLVEVVLRALSHEPDRRYGSVRAFAAAVEAHLEGTAALEQRRRRVEQLVAEGQRLTADLRDFVDSRGERVAEVAELRAQVPPYAPAEEKRRVWDAEDRVMMLDAMAASTLREAASAFERALVELPEHREARRGLAFLWAIERQRARSRRDAFDEAYFGELVRQYDDDGPEGPAQSGALSFDWPVPCEVSLETYLARDRRLVIDGARSLGSPPLSLRVPVGSHRLRLTSGRGTLHRPIFVGPNASLTVGFDRPKVPATSVGEVLVPGGEALVDLGDGLEVQEVKVATFVIQARPVTFGEYLEFLAWVHEELPGRARHHTPRGLDEAAYFRWDGDSFVPLRITEYGDDTELLRALPVFGVSGHSASVYAAWRSRRDRVAYRLPTEIEWQKAGGGVDGRRHPWGDAFDGAYCLHRESREGPPRPMPSGSFPVDCSPYGALDFAGGVADWVTPGLAPLPLSRATGAVTRGGSYRDAPETCSLRARRRYGLQESTPRAGFRLVRDLDRAPDHDEGLLRDTESRPPSGRTPRPR
ncbi:MAG: SUMF1/EgtB/PvdO family nonheme iron enzyme [Myxococcales bacterium]|nr:SUMF1/EgtB/PvdO family nonheme iron enzyme [Myxococcales bacterium]